MIPLELRMKGFLSYREEAVLDFRPFHTACISGHNGAGKSSILDAITWALFGQARRRDDAIITIGADSAQVTFTFAYEGNHYRIIRTKPRRKTAQLEFQIRQPDGAWKALTERALRDTERRIRETLRLEYETFVNAAFFLQGRADSFTQKRPAERKQILASILGLEQWEDYLQRARKRRKAVQAEIEGIRGQLKEVEAELAEEEPRKQRLAQLGKELRTLGETRLAQEQALRSMRQTAASLQERERTVEALARQLESAQKEYAALKERLEARKKERDDYLDAVSRAPEIEAAYQAWLQARQELEAWEELAARFRAHEQRRRAPLEAIQTARARLEEELRSLEGQAAEAEQTRKQQEALQEDIRQAQEMLQTAEKALAERPALEEALQEALQTKGEMEAENRHIQAETRALRERIDTLRAAEGGVCPLCGQALPDEERDTLAEHLESEGRRMKERYLANKQALEEIGRRIANLRRSLRGLETEARRQQQAHKKLSVLETRRQEMQTRLERWEKEGAPRLEEVRRALETESYALEARAALAALDEEAKAIGYDAAQHEAARQAEKAGRAAEQAWQKLERARAALQPLEREIADLEGELAEREQKLHTRQAEYDEEAARLAAAQADLPDLRKAERDLFGLRERENQLRSDVGAARQEVAVLDRQRENRRRLLTRRDDLALQVSRYRQLEEAFGKNGVPALLIEAALPEIEAHANEILERLSNGSMSVRFVTQQAYKDSHRDDLKETLDIQISDEAGTRTYEMYSGGEAFRVNFAIRLALSRVLAQRAGARLQTLVIDEGFGSQDEQGRQRLVEAINLIQGDFEKILIITHIESLKDAFPARIEVEKTPQGSRISVNAT